jgi:Cu(I)/Ag(I) efflux system membrane fusion protein
MAPSTNRFDRLKRILGKVPILLLLIVVFWIGYQFSSAVHRATPTAPSQSNGADSLKAGTSGTEVWTCSMHPQIRLPEPGSCPICGMDLVLAEGTESVATAAAKNKPLYACSMFCLPPQPNPGKCRICGMDMVEVESDAADFDDATSSRTLTLSPTAQKLAEVATEPVLRKFVAAEIRMVGKIDYDETRLGYITAWVPGRLERLFVDYTGIPVNKGDHLVYLYSPELATAQTELLQALERTKSAADGENTLVNRRAAKWVEDIRDKFRLWGMTEEQISDIESRGAPSDYMTIYAPMGGIVIHKNAVEGMYVNTGTRIYTIADLSRVWVKLDAYESDLQWLRYGQEVEFESEAYPGDTFAGRIAFIDPVLDAKTRTVKIRVNVENADGRLKPEMFVRAMVRSKVALGGRVVDAELAGKWISPMHPEIVKDAPGTCDVCGMPLVRAESLGFVSVETQDADPPLVIPASAPLKTGKRALVYVAVSGSPGKYEGREIVLGPRAGAYYIVKEGLEEGERVVVHGAFKIDSAMQIMAKPSMMNPATKDPSVATSQDPRESAPSKPPSTHTPIAPTYAEQGVADTELPIAFGEQLDELYRGYVAIQGALSRDSLDDARRLMNAFIKTLEGVDASLLSNDARARWTKEKTQLVASANMTAQADSIEKARLGFVLVSESVIAIAHRFAPATVELRRFHCPMAFDGRGADWIQLTDQTENPYFGSAMFRCGSLEETIKPKPSRPIDGGDDGQP